MKFSTLLSLRRAIAKIRKHAYHGLVRFWGTAYGHPESALGQVQGDDMHTHHAIDYIEINVTDVAEAKRFYTAAFGWTFNDYGPGYAGIIGEGREQGGLALAAEVKSGGPLVVLYSNDLEKTRAAVRAAGGRLKVDIFDFPGGQRFQFLDPSGNQLAVWSPKKKSE